MIPTTKYWKIDVAWFLFSLEHCIYLRYKSAVDQKHLRTFWWSDIFLCNYCINVCVYIIKRNLFPTKDNCWWNQKAAYFSIQAGSQGKKKERKREINTGEPLLSSHLLSSFLLVVPKFEGFFVLAHIKQPHKIQYT